MKFNVRTFRQTSDRHQTDIRQTGIEKPLHGRPLLGPANKTKIFSVIFVAIMSFPAKRPNLEKKKNMRCKTLMKGNINRYSYRFSLLGVTLPAYPVT